MPTLAEVFALVDSYRASQVKFNIETKVEAGAPEQTAPREQFVAVALNEIKAANMQHRASVQSFDWGSLRLVQEMDPQIRTVALTNKDFLQAGQPDSSPGLAASTRMILTVTLCLQRRTSDSTPFPLSTEHPKTGRFRTPDTPPTSLPTWLTGPTARECRSFPGPWMTRRPCVR